MVGAVGEMASVKRRKLWKMGEDGLCCSSNAIQTRLGPSSLLEERSITPIVFVVFFVLSATPQNWGEMAKVYTVYIIISSLMDFADRDRDEMLLCPIRAIRNYFSSMAVLFSLC